MTRDRLRTILALGLPIIGGMVSQNVLNLVDAAMVGTLGSPALAGVGFASFVNFMAQAFLMGLSAGVQAIAARRHGAGRQDETGVPLNGGLLVALAVGVPVTVALYLAAPALMDALLEDPAVVAEAVPYFQWRVLGITAVGANFAFRGYWNGIGRSTIYLRTLVTMHMVNVILNYVLIFGHLGAPALGTAGAGLGTMIASFVGTGTYVSLSLTRARDSGFLRGLPDRASMVTMLRLAVPNGIQMLLFAAGMTALFWIIGQVGTAELAAANVLVNLTLVAILPAVGLGIAAGSLAGQALGRGDPDDAARWGRDVAKVAVAGLAALGLAMALAPDPFLRVFLHEADALAVARWPLRLVGAFMALDAVGLVFQNALLGVGATRLVMAVSVGLQWGLLLPAAYVIGPVLGHGLLAIWIANVAYRALQAVVFTALWRRGSWRDIDV